MIMKILINMMEHNHGYLLFKHFSCLPSFGRLYLLFDIVLLRIVFQLINRSSQ